MQLASKFARKSPVIRSDSPLTDAEMRLVVPSVFAEEKHDSRSDRYSYIPTIQILDGLRKEGFHPFMACQTRTRDEGKREHTKHMIRLRHANLAADSEINEIILLNSHDGSSSYQMLAGCFRFVCQNGLVCGDITNDIRIPHKGQIIDNVIEGAFKVLSTLETVDEQRQGMKSVVLSEEEQNIFARSALALKYDTAVAPAPITERTILAPRRPEDNKSDLWATFNRVQENIAKGGLRARTATGGRTTTRPVTSIAQGIQLNRALWVLGEEFRKLKA